MATYHGLIKLDCLVCDWSTTEDRTIEIFNDLGGDCPDCNNQFFRWKNQDGSIVVSLTKGKGATSTYENLVYNDCDCDNLDQDIEGYTCYKCYEKGA